MSLSLGRKVYSSIFALSLVYGGLEESSAQCYVVYGPDGKTFKEYNTSPIDLSSSISEGLSNCGLYGYSMQIRSGLCTDAYEARQVVLKQDQAARQRYEILMRGVVAENEGTTKVSPYDESSRAMIARATNSIIVRNNKLSNREVLQDNYRRLWEFDANNIRVQALSRSTSTSAPPSKEVLIRERLDTLEAGVDCIDSSRTLYVGK